MSRGAVFLLARERNNIQIGTLINHLHQKAYTFNSSFPIIHVKTQDCWRPTFSGFLLKMLDAQGAFLSSMMSI